MQTWREHSSCLAHEYKGIKILHTCLEQIMGLAAR